MIYIQWMTCFDGSFYKHVLSFDDTVYTLIYPTLKVCPHYIIAVYISQLWFFHLRCSFGAHLSYCRTHHPYLLTSSFSTLHTHTHTHTHYIHNILPYSTPTDESLQDETRASSGSPLYTTLHHTHNLVRLLHTSGELANTSTSEHS